MKTFEAIYKLEEDKIDKFIKYVDRYTSLKERDQTLKENNQILREASEGKWIPQIKLSEFYRDLSYAVTDEDWPILREYIIKMEDLEDKIFSPTFQLKENKNKLLEQYAKVCIFKDNQLKEFLDDSKLNYERKDKLDLERDNNPLKQDIEKAEQIASSPDEKRIIKEIKNAAEESGGDINIVKKTIKNIVNKVGPQSMRFIKKVGGVIAKCATGIGYAASAFKFGTMFAFMGPPGMLLGAIIGVGVAKITIEVGKLGGKAGNKIGGLLYDWISSALISSKYKAIQSIGNKLRNSPKGKAFIQTFCSIVAAVAVGGITAGALHKAIQGAANQLSKAFLQAIPIEEAEAIVESSSQELQQVGKESEAIIEDSSGYQKINASNTGTYDYSVFGRNAQQARELGEWGLRCQRIIRNSFGTNADNMLEILRNPDQGIDYFINYTCNSEANEQLAKTFVKIFASEGSVNSNIYLSTRVSNGQKIVTYTFKHAENYKVLGSGDLRELLKNVSDSLNSAEQILEKATVKTAQEVSTSLPTGSMSMMNT